MNAAPRLWTDVVSGALGFAALGLSSLSFAVVAAGTPTAFAGASFVDVGLPGVAATTGFAGAPGFAVVATAVLGATGAAGTAGFWFDHDAVGFTVLSVTVPTLLADDDEDVTTWRKN